MSASDAARPVVVEDGWAMPWPGAKLAAEAEAAGALGFCSGEFADSNAYVSLAEMAMATTTAMIGPGIAYARSPFVHASAIRQIHTMAPGRVFLGLGSGTKRMNTSWFAAPFDPALRRMEEMVGAIRAFLTGLRDTRRTPSPLSGSEPFGERLAITMGRAGGMLIGAYLAGVLTIGAGLRLMMRVLAATSPDDVQGRLTEADEIVGNVSVGGSMFLIVIVGMGAAVVGLALFSILRRWLPNRSLAGGLVGVAIGAGVAVRPSGLLTSANSDFTLVAPVALAVALCVATLVLFGATFGVLVDRLAPRWPRPGWSPRGVVSVLPFGALLLAPPLFVATVIGVLGGTFAPRLRVERDHPVQPDGEAATARLGRILVLALGGLGIISIVVAAGQVLAL